jgi:hypothetical protein
LLTIFYALILLWVIRKWSFFHGGGLTPNIISFIFLLKIGFGFLLFAIYYFYYGNNRFTSDAFRFFDDSLVMYGALKTDPTYYLRLLFGIGLDKPDLAPYIKEMTFWGRDFPHGLFNDNQTIIRVNSIFDLFSFGYYHVHTVFMCFFSLIGLTALYKAFVPFLQKLKLLLLFGIFLIPSVLFWSSGVLKEGVVIFSMGLLIWSLFKVVEKPNVKHLSVLIFSILILLFIKVYVIIALAPGIIGFILLTKKNRRHPLALYLSIAITGSLISLGVHNKIPEVDIITKLYFKNIDFIKMSERTRSNSAFYITRLNNNPIEFVKMIPSALTNTTFRPFIWESKSAMMLLNSLENITLFLFGTLCLFLSKKRANIDFKLVGFCLTFIIILYLFIGWTTPISGAIVRYKIPAWPFFMILSLLILDEQKLYSKLPFLEKLNVKIK